MADKSASGFLFHDMTAEVFSDAIRRVAVAYHDKSVWRRLKKNGMTKDFSWRFKRRCVPANLLVAFPDPREIEQLRGKPGDLFSVLNPEQGGYLFQ